VIVRRPRLRTADAATIFNAPQHPYTRALLESVPRIDHSYSGARRVLPSIAGRPPDLLHAPQAAAFMTAVRKQRPNAAG